MFNLEWLLVYFGWLSVFILVAGVFYRIVKFVSIVVSFILGASGCLMLIVRRAMSRELSLYTAPVDYFNLLFLLSIFVTGFISWWIDPSFIHSDKIVISLDEEVRELFYVSSTKLSELKDAIWINPGKIEEKPITWLKNGANNEKHRHLGYRDT